MGGKRLLGEWREKVGYRAQQAIKKGLESARSGHRPEPQQNVAMVEGGLSASGAALLAYGPLTARAGSGRNSGA
jgi:hypothetical protein